MKDSRTTRDIHLAHVAALLATNELWGDPYDDGGIVKPWAGSLHHHRPRTGLDDDEPIIVGMA